MISRRHIRRAAPNPLRPCDSTASKTRLEEVVGEDLARLLLSALAAGPYRGRPDLGPGTSSP